ncbi:MAG: DUF4965 domain-containing protein [Tannerella sp.]|jgi:hypothetical protein|nr:DUF4965 domain-containing protein [Tannerella sp.]
MKKVSIFLLSIALCGCAGNTDKFSPENVNSLRAPAYPLVSIDPYTSAWSMADKLNDDVVRHWTGVKFPLLGALIVDGVDYRFLGVNQIPLIAVLPTAVTYRWEAAYTEKAPVGDSWTSTAFNDAAWQHGRAAFGTPEMPFLSTEWTSKEIWIRRTFELHADFAQEPVILEYSHDDDFTLFINGLKVVETGYQWKNNVQIQLSDEVRATLRPGKNVIAINCKNRTGGAYVDCGLYLQDLTNVRYEQAAVQTSVNVQPTQTYYNFTCGAVDLNLIFTTPLLPDNLDLLSRPISYLSYQVTPNDGRPHEVALHIEATPDWAIHSPDQPTRITVDMEGDVAYLRAGTVEQPILRKAGDNVRIDWGYFYLAGNVKDSKGVNNTNLTFSPPAMCLDANIGSVSAAAEGFVMLGYDDVYSIQYFHDNRRAYWTHNGTVSFLQALVAAGKEYPKIMRDCAAFDRRLIADATRVGGKEYAELCALAYRQSVSAHKLIEDADGNLLFLSKENFSNGSIGTVDISYPSSPLYLHYNPDLLKGMLTPIFYFSESGKWTKPFPSHDVGTYPLANGQTYGGDMPVEEGGNMLILTTAIAIAEGNADYARTHWKTLTTWADYLVKEGLDPENQLCTDDFAGHFAHNANLSIKAIMGIAGYGKLAGMLGDKATSDKYISTAREMAQKWVQMADDGDHYRLTFDKADTWSQKYNLVWDKLFGMSIFPSEVAATEVAYYLKKQNKYGLPLDSRKDYTKSDWIIWSACLATSPEDFRALISPLHLYADQTVSRIPLSDWHDTKDSHSIGFRARSVVGGYFMKMLSEDFAKKK